MSNKTTYTPTGNLNKKCVFVLLWALCMGLTLVTSAQTFNELYFTISADIANKSYISALGNIDKVLQFQPNNADLLQKRADCNFLQSNFTEALNDYLKVESLANGRASFHVAKCYAILGKYDEAIQFINENIESKYKKPQRIYKSDIAFQGLSKSKKWAEFWKLDYYSNFENSIAEVEYYLESGKFEKALELIDELLLSHNQNNDLHHLKAKALAAVDRGDEAITEYALIIRNKSNLAIYYIERANVYAKMEKYNKALIDLNKALDLEPMDLTTLKSRAYSEWNLKKYNEAVADYQQYLLYYDKDFEAIYNCGLVLYDKQEYQSALLFFNKLFVPNKNKVQYFVARGNTFLACKSYALAETDFNQALDLDPFSGLIYLNRGIARIEQGFVDGACFDWQKASELKELDALEFLEKHCSQNIQK